MDVYGPECRRCSYISYRLYVTEMFGYYMRDRVSNKLQCNEHRLKEVKVKCARCEKNTNYDFKVVWDAELENIRVANKPLELLWCVDGVWMRYVLDGNRVRSVTVETN